MNESEQEHKSSVENLTDHLSDYVETHLKLGAVNATQKATEVATISLTTAFLSMFCIFILFFSGLGMSIWLGELWGNNVMGYFAVAGFHVAIALIFIALRKKLIFPWLRNQIIRKVYE